MKTDNVLLTKSKAFALRILKLYQYLKKKHEPVLASQILRSGTSIGANVYEAENAQTKPDFYAKLYIAYKEVGETGFWLELLHEGGYIMDTEFDSIYTDCKEITRLLAAITKTQKDHC